MAKTKQDYFNAGISDFKNNFPRKFQGIDSWQARNYSLGWNSASLEIASETQSQCIDLPYQIENTRQATIHYNGLYWVIVDLSTRKHVSGKHGNYRITRKTHARKIAEKIGYKIVG